MRRWRFGHAVAIVVATLVALVASAARSPASAQTLIVEGHVGARSPDAERVLGPVRSALERAPGTLATADVSRRYRAERSRAGAGHGEASDLQARLRRLVSAGNDAWMNADFDRARAIFERAVEVSREAPSEAAGRISWRPMVQRSLVGVALSAKRRGDGSTAESAMAEFLRTYPGDVVDRTTFGPEAWKLYEAVRKSLSEQPTGRLTVSVDDPDAVVFVNERYAGVGSVRLEDLLPGTYRVHVRKGASPGRIYDAQVLGGTEAVVEVTWSFDAALSTDGWVGFSFPDEEAKARLLDVYALRLGRMLGAKTIVVLELDGTDERRAVAGSVLSVDSTRATRTASMAVAPVEPSAETLATLGDYLSGARPGLPQGAVEVAAEKPRGRKEWGHALLWGIAGAGAAAVLGGVTLVVLDGRCKDLDPDLRSCPTIYDTKLLGVATLALGAAALGSAAYLRYLRGRRPRTTPVAALAPSGAYLGLAGTF